MTPITRRKFIQRATALGAGALTLPHFSIGRAGDAANQRLGIAIVGSGGKITKGAILGAQEENLVAVCDADDNRILRHVEDCPFMESAARFRDYRKMFDALDGDIDAVVVATPDHTHYDITLEAMRRGKHVITQKPLTNSIAQSRRLREVAEETGVVTNMWNQGHTSAGIREIREWVEAGVLGDVTEVHSWHPGPIWGTALFKRGQTTPPEPEPVPKNLDWDVWLGQAADPGFNQVYHPSSWRGFLQFGTGQIGDWFCHISDGPVWALGLYDAPVVEAEKIDGPVPGMCPDGSIIRWDFPARGSMPACALRWYDGGNAPEIPADWSWGTVPKYGSFLVGTKATAFLDERSSNPRLVNKEAMREFKEAGGVPEKFPRLPKGGPMAEWIAAIKGNGPKPGSSFDYASRLTEVALLGVLAQEFGGRINWDSAAMRDPARPELDARIDPPRREGWNA